MLHVTVHVVHLGEACHDVEGHAGFAALHDIVVAVEFGKCLLQQYRPQFLTPGIAKRRLIILITGNIIIDVDGGLFSGDEKVDFVDSGSIDFLSAEEGFYAVGVFGDGGHGAEEVTITQFPLIHIISSDPLSENSRILKDLTGSFPLQIFIISL